MSPGSDDSRLDDARLCFAEMSEAGDLLGSTDVWEMTLPWLPVYWDVEILRRYRQSGYSFVSATLSDWPASFAGTLRAIERFREIAAAHADWLVSGSSLAEIDHGRAEGRLVMGMNAQETRILD